MVRFGNLAIYLRPIAFCPYLAIGLAFLKLMNNINYSRCELKNLLKVI